MPSILIRNIGPIKEAQLSLNRINVFMGPQSSGKSTLAKIISYCTWFEKNSILKTRTQSDDFWEELMTFHNLENDYFNEDSLIEYTTECFHLTASKSGKLTVEDLSGPDRVFKNRKIEYIPAERNLVTLPGIGKYNDSQDNILNFLYDWFQAKQTLKQEEAYSLPLSSLHASYMYDKKNDSDYIILESGKRIRLRHASSGLMSVTPLLIVFQFIVNGIYQKERTKTPLEIANRTERLSKLTNEHRKKAEELGQKMQTFQNELEDLLRTDTQQAKKHIYHFTEELNNILGYYSEYAFSDIIIEEPEQNLFPQTQRDLIYYMLKQLNISDRTHTLTLTTHSPYILFALNNCMMGGLVGDKITDTDRQDIPSAQSWFNPHLVSVYEIHDGMLRKIQDEDGIIEDNYLNQAYKEITAEYLNLLDFYDNEK